MKSNLETEINTYSAKTLAMAGQDIEVTHADFSRKLEKQSNHLRNVLSEIARGDLNLAECITIARESIKKNHERTI
jgi:hypothetical protein